MVTLFGNRDRTCRLTRAEDPASYSMVREDAGTLRKYYPRILRGATTPHRYHMADGIHGPGERTLCWGRPSVKALYVLRNSGRFNENG